MACAYTPAAKEAGRESLASSLGKSDCYGLNCEPPQSHLPGNSYVEALTRVYLYLTVGLLGGN